MPDKIVTARIACEIGYHEAVIREAYRDSVGTWTWSVGLTNATGHNVERYIDNPQTMEHCLNIYVWALNNYADAVRQTFDDFPMTEEQFGGALSFHWNTGSIRKASWVDAMKSGDMKDAEARFMLWNRPPEIVQRRKKEADLLFRGIWANDGKMTEYDIHSNHNPNWASGRRFDALPILEAIINDTNPAPPDIDGNLVVGRLMQLEARIAELERWRKS